MVRKSILVIVAATMLMSTSSLVFAGTSSFSISPPPIATPVFDVKESDMKIGLTYLSMKSSSSNTTTFKLSGGGINAVGRTSFGNNVLAIDYAIGVMYMTGNINMGTMGGESDISGASIPISFNLEVQPVKNDAFNLILFAGPSFNITAMQMDINTPYYSDTIYIDSYMYGLQGGVQAGIGMGPVNLDLFAMATNLRGTQDTTSTYGGSTSTDIDAYTTTSYGADLMYTPWGLALSSILQEAKQNDNSGFKTKLYTISWSHKF